VRIIRRSYDHIDDLMFDFPNATTVFNCTGLGARNLGGVRDEKVHPTKVYRSKNSKESLILIPKADLITIGPNTTHF